MKAHGPSMAAQECRNLITVGLVMLRCASMRKESRGLHCNTAGPHRHFPKP
jgi:aspartate oxidase